jgi:hypothetical protein
MMKRIIHQMIDTHEIWGFSDLNLRLCSSHNRLFPQTVNFVHEAVRLEGRHLSGILKAVSTSA